MISGHGDDAFLYSGITMDFSSNIAQGPGHQALMDHLASRPQLLAHYPEPEAWSLERELARRLGVDADCVLVTSGATEAIYLVAQAFPWRPVIVGPTFSEYADACALFPATDSRRSVLWLCNPNNPTGTIRSRAEVLAMSAGHSLTVVDQSYERYTHGDLLTAPEVVERGTIVTLHSMTKTYAVPGLRLGYLVAAAPLCAAVRRCLRPWSVSALAVEAGHFLLAHPELAVSPDLAEARRLRSRLQQVQGISVAPTDTTFMLCCLSSAEGPWAAFTAARLKQWLASRHGMLVRDASNFAGLTPRHFRVAARTPAENDALVAALATPPPPSAAAGAILTATLNQASTI